jgi:hypothetical protein
VPTQSLGPRHLSLTHFHEAICSRIVNVPHFRHQAASRGAEQDLTDPLVWYRLANECRSQGHVEAWVDCVDQAFSLDHSTREQVYARGRAKLTLGDWSGWADLRSKHYDPVGRSRYETLLSWRHREWDGCEDLTDKTLLVYLERGFGDGLQMLRFVPQLARSARRVLLAVRTELAGLIFHNLGSSVSLTLRGWDLPERFDRYVWSMSLPVLLAGLPPFLPLKAPAPVTYKTARRKLRVGLCWAGDPRHGRDAQRSMSLEELEPLVLRADLECVTLQVGKRAADAKRYPMLVEPDPPLRSFADTANVLSSLDAVVTIDTAVCHLAACMGIQTYLMLDNCAEFRWGLAETTPWYPTMILVRQQKRGGWDGVVRTIDKQLGSLAE